MSWKTSADPAKIDSVQQYEQWLSEKENQKKVVEYLKKEGIGIDALELLSTRAFNLLSFAGYTQLHQILFMNAISMGKIPRMDRFLVAEVQMNGRDFLRKNKQWILAGVFPPQVEDEQEEEDEEPSLPIHIARTALRCERLLTYVRRNDLSLAQMQLSDGAAHVLERNQHHAISDIIFLDKKAIKKLHYMEKAYAEEILEKLREYLKDHWEKINAYVDGNDSALISEKAICDAILDAYRDLGFEGLHFSEIIATMKVEMAADESRVKRCIGKLLAEGKLTYTDFRVYRVHPSFLSFLKEHEKEQDKGYEWVLRILQGEPAEEVAHSLGYIQERFRKLIKQIWAYSRLQMEHGTGLYDEDYYSYLYTNYFVDSRVYTKWLGVSVVTYRYLDLFHTKGARRLADALDDPKIDTCMKLRISNYLNKDKLFVAGKWIEKTYAGLETYVLAKYCTDSVSVDEFGRRYNEFLSRQRTTIPGNLYYGNDGKRGCINRLQESHFALCDQNHDFRYYDVDAGDYTELFDTLKLDVYENTMLSTKKLAETYPDLMTRYALRDHYELHNLLKKIVPEGSYHDFRCEKPPRICFGKFNRSEAILNLLISNAPITKADLVDLIHAEYGYDKGTIETLYLSDIKEYYYKGVYTIDAKVMSSLHKEQLQDRLTEDFYFIDEIKSIYAEAVSGADLEEINPYNLKLMGFQVRSEYVLKNHSSLEAYFKHIMLAQDIIDITEMKKRFGGLVTWGHTLSVLKQSYEILEFEPNQILSFRKLEKGGITKDMLKAFCDAAWRHLEDSAHFTARSLCGSGFDSPLYELGFSDWFYGNILCNDPRFSFCPMWGGIVLCKGTGFVNGKSFLTDIVRRAGKIDVVDLIGDMQDIYGFRSVTKQQIMYCVRDSELFYDPILERLYANAELYYRELDEGI